MQDSIVGMLVITFLILFGGLTLVVMAEQGIDLLVVISLLLIVGIGIGVVGALRQPPEE